MKLLFSSSRFSPSERSGWGVFVDEEKEAVTSTTPDLTEKEKQIKGAAELEKVEAETKPKLKNHAISVEEQKRIEEEKKRIEEEAKKEAARISASIKKDLGTEDDVKNLTLKSYGKHLSEVRDNYVDDIEAWFKKYGKICPDAWQDNLKIGAVAGVFAYGASEGSPLKRAGKAAFWVGTMALLTHPTLTQGIADSANYVGKNLIGPSLVALPSLIISLIDDPQEIWDAAMETDAKGALIDGDVPLLTLLTTGRNSSQNLEESLTTETQSIFDLRAKGLVIGDENLAKSMNDMDEYEANKKQGLSVSFPEKSIKDSVTFILQMAEHKMSDEAYARAITDLWNKKTMGQDRIRRVLATNGEREIFDFFHQNDELRPLFEAEMEAQTLNIKNIPKADLSTMFIDGTAKKSEKEFQFSKKTRGIHRFLKMGGGGMAIALYAFSFLTITILMKLKGGFQAAAKLFQPSAYREGARKTIEWGKDKIFALGALVGLGPKATLDITKIKPEQGDKIIDKFASAKDSPLPKYKNAIWKSINKSDADKAALIAQTQDFFKKEAKEKDWKCERSDLPPIIQSKLAEAESGTI